MVIRINDRLIKDWKGCKFMFTGIVEEIGLVEGKKPFKESFRLALKGNMVYSDLKLGDSVAVNGVCLTAALLKGGGSFEVDVMPETLRSTNLNQLSTGSPVNMERAMRFDNRFGGHFVSGHVDEMGKILYRRVEGNALLIGFSASNELLSNMVKKGSVAIDGVSLTVATIFDGGFSVSLIPHTLDNTILDGKKKNDTVNLEADILGKYVSNYLKNIIKKSDGQSGRELTMDYLTEKGF